MKLDLAAPNLERWPGRSRWVLAAGVCLALLVLAGTILVSVLHLREHIREQVAARDGETLDAVAAMQRLDDTTSGEAIAGLEDPGEQLELVMKISRLRNVVGVRLFSAKGEFVNAFPERMTEGALAAIDLTALRALQPVSHFLPRARLQELDLLAATNALPVPLLEINLPLHEEGAARLDGVAQFIMNGSSIAAEYAELDRHLAVQGALAFGIGGSILVSGLVLAFRRVQRANSLLARRTSDLLKANRELALAAKTSAVGAVTSHLIHGLKNPLSGLQSFVRNRAQDQANGHDTEWQLAVATTKRMETLINRTVNVLQEQQTAVEYQISLAELADIVSSKLQPQAKTAGVRLETIVNGAGTLGNRDADLVLLILENLLQNALEATPVGKAVKLRVFAEAERVAMEVEDEGPGLAPEVVDRLFAPCASAKKGGSGIGLAISRELAKHLGAALELKSSSSRGCVFRLVLPASAPQTDFAEATAKEAALP